MVKINQDGSVDVITALMDHGGGTLEAFAKMVAEALCVPLDKVNISPAGHPHDRLRRGHARHARRLCRRRRRDEGHAEGARGPARRPPRGS